MIKSLNDKENFLRWCFEMGYLNDKGKETLADVLYENSKKREQSNPPLKDGER